MITIRVESTAVQNRLKNAGPALRKHIYRALQRKTRQLTAQLKTAAPKKSGRLARAIYGRTYQQPLRAIIGIPTILSDSGFDYPQFVTGAISIKVDKPNKYFQQGQTLMYGRGGLSPNGNAIQWKANYDWWMSVQQHARRSYPQVVRQAVKSFSDEMNM
jgi:hypothetical protein